MNKTMKAALEQVRRQFGEPLTKPTKEERCLCGSTKWRDQVEGATWDADHSSHYILARDMAAILDRIESQSRPVAAAAEANAHRQAAPSSTRPILRELHDRLGAMIDQVGQPDYSLREMVNGLREVRDALYEEFDSMDADEPDRTPSAIEESEEILENWRVAMVTRLRHLAKVTPYQAAPTLVDAAIEAANCLDELYVRTRSQSEEINPLTATTSRRGAEPGQPAIGGPSPAAKT